MQTIATYRTERGSAVTATRHPWPTTGEPTYPVECSGCGWITARDSEGEAEHSARVHAAICLR
jgi:hypothetical protein